MNEASARAELPLEGRRLVFAFVGLMIGNTMSGLDSTIVATAAPTIVAELGSLSLLPWIASVYLLTQIATMPLYGKLGDLFGRKRIFLVAIGLFLLGSVLCATAQSLQQLIAFRAVQGAGAGGLTGVAMALVADIAPPARQGRFLGYAGLVFAVTSTIGPLAGGFFVDQLTWRWAFYVNVPSGMVAVLIVTALIPRIRPGIEHDLDLGGAALLAAATTSVVLALSWGGVQFDWASVQIIGLGLGSLALVAAFVVRQRRAPEPILPARIFAERQVGLAIGANLIAGVGFFGGIVYLPVFFQAVTGASATRSGMLLVPLAVSTALSTVAVGEVVDRFGGAKLFPVMGMALLVVGYSLLAQIDADTSRFVIAGCALVVGVGVGFVMQVLLLVVQRSVRPSDLGVASSSTVLGRILGGALGIAVLGTVFNNRFVAEIAKRSAPGEIDVDSLQGDPESVALLPDGVREAVIDSFAGALGATYRVAIPIMVVGLVVALALPARVLRSRLAASSGLEAADPVDPIEHY